MQSFASIVLSAFTSIFGEISEMTPSVTRRSHFLPSGSRPPATRIVELILKLQSLEILREEDTK
ncbi:unannotated protein [freshwater metagenome]|uniref:Unannotated protein n=1 Tax=freshwater metagenome TaxID=449393 RepID=A0A6J6AD91_9ZZZZ